MYKLTIVDGPNRGTSYVIKEGQTSLGRGSANVVHLPSSKVSKNHCVVAFSNGKLNLKDLGSSNGTFVNGILTKDKEVHLGDRISVGPYIFEVAEAQAHSAQAMPVMADLNQDPNALAIQSNVNELAEPETGLDMDMDDSIAASGPGDWQEKLMFLFEKYVMPVFYSLNLKYEWKWIATGVFSSFILMTLLISVSPLLEANQQTILIESGRRARYMAQQIAQINTPRLAANSNAKTSVGNVNDEFGVRVGVITDLQNRIIAPPEKANQYLKRGAEARFSLKAAKAFRSGRETGVVQTSQNEIVVAIEPIKILDRRAGKNKVVAMAVVSLDATLSTPQMGTIAFIYSKTLILMIVVGGIILFLFYRLTLKPFELLRSDIDKVLQGDFAQVTHDFKNEDLNELYSVVNSALQRIPKGGGAEGLGGLSESGEEELDQAIFDEVSSIIRMIGQDSKAGYAVCTQERNVSYLNPIFEDVAGINLNEALGQDLSVMGRDQAFSELVTNLFDTAQVTLNTEVIEDFDFSGINYEMKAIAFGKNNPVGFLISATRKEEGEI